MKKANLLIILILSTVLAIFGVFSEHPIAFITALAIWLITMTMLSKIKPKSSTNHEKTFKTK